MTNTLTISRELLGVYLGVIDGDWVEAGHELRAILAAPAVERQPDAIIEGVMTSVGITHAIYASTVSLKDKEQVKLYASPPAPVAVVLPERNNAKLNLSEEQCGYVDGWNACLDKVKEMNR